MEKYNLILTDYVTYTAQSNKTFKEMEDYLIQQLTLSDYENKNIYDYKRVEKLLGGIVENDTTGETVNYYNFSEAVNNLYNKYHRLYFSHLYKEGE